MRARSRLVRDERGAEILEFALVFPVVSFLVFGLIYGLFAVAAYVSLTHATSRGVRYASIASDPVAGVYPSAEEVEAFVDDQTPFFNFATSACETTLDGEQRENEPVTLDVACDFPNPAGRALSALRNFLLDRDDPDVYADSLLMTATAKARRE